MEDLQIVTTSNGLRIANFSSPHAFTFIDGSVLPAVSNETAEKYKIQFHEQVTSLPFATLTIHNIKLSFGLTVEVDKRIKEFHDMWIEQYVDIILCPLPMIQAMKDEGYDILYSPFRSIRIKDRINKLIEIDRFCI